MPPVATLHLLQCNSNNRCHRSHVLCRVLRLCVTDEARIASCFEALTHEFPDVAAGSYPAFAAGAQSALTISLEAKDAQQVCNCIAPGVIGCVVSLSACFGA